jgi:hypothetical protein
VPGIARWTMNCNWKFAADNAIGDMYHGSTAHRSAVLVGHGTVTGTPRGAKSLAGRGQKPGWSVVTEYGHGFNANFVEPDFRLDAPLAYWRNDPAVQARLGPIRGKVNRSNMNVFPNLFVNSGSRELMLRNPMGPTKVEILKTTLVDRNAPPEIQREQVRASNRHFGPAGMFEQEDGENWDQSTFGARGTVARRHPLHYGMAVGHGKIVADDLGPPRVETLTNEHCQLWFYRCWAEMMAAANWQELQETHSRPEGRL